MNDGEENRRVNEMNKAYRGVFPLFSAEFRDF